jgi:pyruvate,orthophosphate dikinase
MKIPFLIGGRDARRLDPARAGGKAAGLSRMAALGLPVPAAFVLPADLCRPVIDGDPRALARVDAALRDGIAFLEARMGRRFGDRRRPLLVSVRSGAARSMPGMLETVLDVGCTRTAAAGLVRLSGNPSFALDCRRRFLESFLETVVGASPPPQADTDASADCEQLRERVEVLEAALAAVRPEPLDDPWAQLREATLCVYASWDSARARAWRQIEGIGEDGGTAVTVQAMVYGNAGSDCAAGVAFSRDPSSGEPEPVVEVLFDAQGEDVVSGRRTPADAGALRARLPAVAARLEAALVLLERELGDVQDVEFTVEHGDLWLLQTRAAKRSAPAALRFAIDLVDAGVLDPREALLRVGGLDVRAFEATRLADPPPPLAQGIAAAPGVASGPIALDVASAQRSAAAGMPAILVREDTSTADVEGFAVAAGVLTVRGGRTAHAALVARQLGRPCVSGCAALSIDAAARRVVVGGTLLGEGDWIAIDGDRGTLHAGRLEVTREAPAEALARLEAWRRLARESPAAA